MASVTNGARVLCHKAVVVKTALRVSVIDPVSLPNRSKMENHMFKAEPAQFVYLHFRITFKIHFKVSK